MIALHLGGVPEASMVLGPIVLIVVFIRIARRHEADVPDDDHDDWDADLGDLPSGADVDEAQRPRQRVAGPRRRPTQSR